MKDIEYYVRTKNINVLCRYYFPDYKPAKGLTKKQQDIVRLIAYAENPRSCINAMTRWGKSACVAMGVAMYILFHKNKKIAIIAPTEDQASIIRNYVAEIIIMCPALAALVDLDMTQGIDRLKRETSRRRWTFKNNCELRTISAHGEAHRLMGFGADLIIVDEAALISKAAYAKIIRMLGDDPENAILIELSNPWSMDSKYYEHYTSGRFMTIHVGYKTAIQEGRTTKAFIDEMRAELGGEESLEFTVLYKSQFPEEAQDSLYRYSWIQGAIENHLQPVRDVVISCDPAEQGRDMTVIMQGKKDEEGYKVEDVYSEAKSDPMNVADKIIQRAITAEKTLTPSGRIFINVDSIGLGSGIVSRLKQVFAGNQRITITACHYGQSPTGLSTHLDKLPTSSKNRFTNRKAEQYFRNAELMRDGMIDIPNHKKLKSELLSMKKKQTVNSKWLIVDPEDKSPDFSDALVYFTWHVDNQAEWFFG